MMKMMMRMIMWLTGMLFNQFNSVQTKLVSQPNPRITADVGANVTLRCFRLEEGTSGIIVWYKQKIGHGPRVMVAAHQWPSFEDEFKSPRFSIEKDETSCHLKITSVDPSDEAMYFCTLGNFLTIFADGTYLSVKGDGDLKLSVFQSSVQDSVPAGASVTLQCSVCSESRAAELRVFWFRAAPPQSDPQIIYTHHDSSRQCERVTSTHTCVYNFSKNILSLNDTGTYYCAVALCGKIILGKGTLVQMETFARSLNPVVMCLGTALVMCGILISVQTVLLCKRKNSQQYSERFSTVVNNENLSSQGDEAVVVNYAALHFIEKKSKRSRENRGPARDTLYSEVKSSTFTH